ncbi:glycosyltransferase [Bradyrhizobium sp. 141]|uniref:glycosyltransferase family 2 protein n=1 Tax=Bradyrhizobium sp. 141 TaxID=2782617 RepID=UPI001FF89376|nr:glycosyltransferase [Bradyrhizobium sp. 141]MCK1716805.1 glycosyltransferase [Bradyrhizobium sp. 141]
MAKVDIVVPCYNYGRFLEACVSSILSQSISDVRVLIIDDCSSDDSVSVARRLEQSDPRVTVIAHSRNHGHINTFNEGIAWASSEYFLLLSADDLLVPGALQRATEIMDASTDVVLTYGECVLWFDDLPFPKLPADENRSWRRQDLIKEMCTTARNDVPSATAIARTRTQKAIGGYRTSLPHAGDMEMWLRFAAHGTVAQIDAVQGIYRKHSSAMSNAYFAKRILDYRQCLLAFESFFDDCEERVPNSRSLRAQARHTLAHQVFRSGIGLLRRGRLRDGLCYIREAMTMDRRLRYFPPVWRVLKIPGKDGRQWALSAIRRVPGRLLE